jgi:hypothetical protein
MTKKDYKRKKSESFEDYETRIWKDYGIVIVVFRR